MAEQLKTSNSTTLSDFIWKVAEDLWGDFRHTDFARIMMPLLLLRRLECVLEPTRASCHRQIPTRKRLRHRFELDPAACLRSIVLQHQQLHLGHAGHYQHPRQFGRLRAPVFRQRAGDF